MGKHRLLVRFENMMVLASVHVNHRSIAQKAIEVKKISDFNLEDGFTLSKT